MGSPHTMPSLSLIGWLLALCRAEAGTRIRHRSGACSSVWRTCCASSRSAEVQHHSRCWCWELGWRRWRWEFRWSANLLGYVRLAQYVGDRRVYTARSWPSACIPGRGCTRCCWRRSTCPRPSAWPLPEFTATGLRAGCPHSGYRALSCVALHHARFAGREGRGVRARSRQCSTSTSPDSASETYAGQRAGILPDAGDWLRHRQRHPLSAAGRSCSTAYTWHAACPI